MTRIRNLDASQMMETRYEPDVLTRDNLSAKHLADQGQLIFLESIRVSKTRGIFSHSIVCVSPMPPLHKTIGVATFHFSMY
ncbi:hypothetical protein ABKN59_010530 [Abortiporus biennis]